MLKVLLVEDENVIRRGLKFMVNWTEQDCVVVGEACDGLEGIEKIKELSPDIVITDVQMPHLSGLEMVERTIGDYHYHAIVLSGFDEFEYAKKAIRLGVIDYLLKPVDLDELKGCLIDIKQSRTERHQEPIADQSLALPDMTSIQNKYVGVMLQYIREHFAEQISLTDLSQRLNISCTHLNSKFKLEVGYTFHDFLNYYRITQAIALHQQKNIKLYEIAGMVGFSDYKYFNKVFKKYVGYPPSQLSTKRL